MRPVTEYLIRESGTPQRVHIELNGLAQCHMLKRGIDGRRATAEEVKRYGVCQGCRENEATETRERAVCPTCFVQLPVDGGCPMCSD